MDYRKYKLKFREKAAVLVVSALAAAGISWLFYDNWYGFAMTPLAYLLAYRLWADEMKKKRQMLLTEEFIDALKAVSTSLLAGYSMENAWKEAQKELALLRGTDGDMYREMDAMNRKIRMNVPLEQLLHDFGLRSGNADIMEFAEVFRFAKRSGGNFTAIISATAGRINGKFETEKEIEVTVASKKLEQKLMDVIPLGILAYLKLASGDYMSALYGNLFGKLFMSICLGAYAGALWISRKVLDIHV